MNQPEHILRTLDSHLRQPTRLILYGRGALALGYPQSLPAFHATMDVDAILPEVAMATIDADEQFWLAVERTNEHLDGSGLYFTHLFTDAQVILRPHWLANIVPINLGDLQFLLLFRPATEDLILTKMMRVDPQDRDDIEFLLRQKPLTPAEIAEILAAATVPEIPEIQTAFEQNSEWLKQRSGQ